MAITHHISIGSFVFLYFILFVIFTSFSFFSFNFVFAGNIVRVCIGKRVVGHQNIFPFGTLTLRKDRNYPKT